MERLDLSKFINNGILSLVPYDGWVRPSLVESALRDDTYISDIQLFTTGIPEMGVFYQFTYAVEHRITMHCTQAESMYYVYRGAVKRNYFLNHSNYGESRALVGANATIADQNTGIPRSQNHRSMVDEVNETMTVSEPKSVGKAVDHTSPPGYSAKPDKVLTEVLRSNYVATGEVNRQALIKMRFKPTLLHMSSWFNRLKYGNDYVLSSVSSLSEDYVGPMYGLVLSCFQPPADKVTSFHAAFTKLCESFRDGLESNPTAYQNASKYISGPSILQFLKNLLPGELQPYVLFLASFAGMINHAKGNNDKTNELVEAICGVALGICPRSEERICSALFDYVAIKHIALRSNAKLYFYEPNDSSGNDFPTFEDTIPEGGTE